MKKYCELPLPFSLTVPESCKTMLLFITVLLLGTSLLVNAGSLSETVTTCVENVVHRLSCDNYGVISVQTSLYGRVDSSVCSEGRRPDQVSNTDCSLPGVVDIVKRRCNGKKVCELSTDAFTSDPCRGTAKYLQTTYTCLSAFHSVTCEHSLARLKCDEGQIITVYGADYGRRDQTTCIYGRPISQILNTACFNPTNQVADSCEGKNSCTIKAFNSVFGDPCEGTYKYLEVAYACQYPSINQADAV
uniref:SUEL-type lectin domain-containing protein n=1 Tax=Iconisemion striatum TaxID=60296 RepID=A0A1A7XN46_9TELE